MEQSTQTNRTVSGKPKKAGETQWHNYIFRWRKKRATKDEIEKVLR